jgi:hypothetical protein
MNTGLDQHIQLDTKSVKGDVMDLRDKTRREEMDLQINKQTD